MDFRLTTMTAAVALMLFTPIAAYAQDLAAAPPGTVAPSAIDTKSDTYTQQKLDQMLAPIALYPDQLMLQILMASTFPLEVVDASRWLNDPSNAALKGSALVAALQPMNWDPSVKSIAAFPAIVAMLNKNLDWTDSLGVAFSRQQAEVMAQVQFLRQQARTAGNLASNDKIVVKDDGPNIVIGLADPNVIYAPYYNPAVVYGRWPWAEYPPVYFSPGYFGLGPLGVEVGWAYGPAWPIVPAFWGWYGANWGMGSGIFINGGGYSQIAYGNAAWGGGNWQHPGGAISHGGSGGGVTSAGSGRGSGGLAGVGSPHGGGAYAGAAPTGAHGGGAYAGAARTGAHGGGAYAGAARTGAHGGGSFAHVTRASAQIGRAHAAMPHAGGGGGGGGGGHGGGGGGGHGGGSHGR